MCARAYFKAYLRTHTMTRYDARPHVFHHQRMHRPCISVLLASHTMSHLRPLIASRAYICLPWEGTLLPLPTSTSCVGSHYCFIYGIVPLARPKCSTMVPHPNTLVQLRGQPTQSKTTYVTYTERRKRKHRRRRQTPARRHSLQTKLKQNKWLRVTYLSGGKRFASMTQNLQGVIYSANDRTL